MQLTTEQAEIVQLATEQVETGWLVVEQLGPMLPELVAVHVQRRLRPVIVLPSTLREEPLSRWEGSRPLPWPVVGLFGWCVVSRRYDS